MQNVVESENQAALAHCFLNAWLAVNGQSAHGVGCSWHFEKALDLNIKVPKLLAAIKKLRILTDKAEFNLQYQKLEHE